MNPQQEQTFLASLLESVDQPVPKRTWRYWLASILLWLATAVMFFVLFSSGQKIGGPHLLLGLVCFGLGAFFAYDFIRAASNQQWPIMVKYVNREEVARRLAELRT